MYNRSVLCGRIANDLELKQTDSGRVYLRFSLAVNNVYNKNVDFVPVTVWNQAAQNVHRYMKKGSMVLVDGAIQVRTVGTDNNRRTYFNISANRVVFLESKNKNTTNEASFAPSKSTTESFSEIPREGNNFQNPIPPVPSDTSESSSTLEKPSPSASADTTEEIEEEGIYWSEK